MIDPFGQGVSLLTQMVCIDCRESTQPQLFYVNYKGLVCELAIPFTISF